MKKFIFSLFALTVVSLPLFAFATSSDGILSTGDCAPQGSGIPFWAPCGLLSCTGNPYIFDANGVAITSPNYCKTFNGVIGTARRIIYFAITIALFAIMPILFLWGGIMFMFSQGKPEGINKAKKILTGAVIGLCIMLGAWLIVNTLVTVLGIQKYVGGFTG